MRDMLLVAMGAALTAITLGVIGLNRAQTPNAAYSAMTLGVVGVCILATAAIALWSTS